MPPISNFQRSCIAVAVSQAALPFLGTSEVSAATINVDTDCTIYEAFDTANGTVMGSAVGCVDGDVGADTIVLPINGNINLDIVNGPGLLVSSEITVQGNRSRIRGGQYDAAKRLIELTAGADLTINNLQLRDGYVAGGEGGAILVRDASLTINNSTLKYNNATNGSGGAIAANGASTVAINQSYFRANLAVSNTNYGRGGAIYLRPGARLTISSSRFSNNEATTGGAIGLLTLLPVQISDSVFSNNIAYQTGGAVASGIGAPLTLTNTRANSNRANVAGGAIYLKSGSLSLIDSLMTNNLALSEGGALRIFGEADLDIQGSTFSQNRVRPNFIPEVPIPTKYRGGAISLDSVGGLPINISRTISNSTFSTNYARYGGAIDIQTGPLTVANSTIVVPDSYLNNQGLILPNLEGYAVAVSASATLDMANTVISGNPLSKPAEFGTAIATAHCSFGGGNALIGNTNNHFQDDSCDGVADGQAGLSPLFDYTVRTNITAGNYGYSIRSPFYHIPTFNSALINAGDPTVCAGALVDGADQRGLTHASPQCDIGAIDSREAIVIVDDIGDRIADGVAVCTLRDAMISVGGESETARPGNTCGVSYDQTTIRFAPSILANGATSIQVGGEGGLPTVRRVTQIQGPGQSQLTIEGDGNSRILRAYGAYLSVANLTIAGGSASSRSSGIYASGSQLLVSQTTLTGNQTFYSNTAGIVGGEGGAIGASRSYVTISNSTVSANTSGRGGGINLRRNSTLILNSSTVSGNSAGSNPGSQSGGGISMASSSVAKISNSTVSGNSAETGGGLYLSSASAIIYNSTIASNTAAFGGGINARAVAIGPPPKPIGEIEKLGAGAVTLGDPAPESEKSFVHVINSIVSGNGAPTSVWPSGVELNLGTGTNFVSYGSLLGSAEKDFITAISTGGDALNLQNSSILATSTLEDSSPNPNRTAFSNILQPLARNGGPTRTHNLAQRSPAIDSAGLQAMCTIFDQRGFRRDNKCDMGAVEIQGESFFIIKAANGAVISFSL